ncbi:Formate hydrogenlyase transcriptional activator [Thalassoglobus neptunius]|uniref:Formate hydrogenlyase transcriptional activator n=1 Tax=Thalassoglobus neptunius TaxID=1938619 RepID=A0A5C5X582_9PLAN|nr:sigma-54 dependent transcriptional regulator [Thalassoglobus neptunius]TWT58186.1 Formate hydrogenlyase transcriptional activator [Thalassoglobus neptunius]
MRNSLILTQDCQLFSALQERVQPFDVNVKFCEDAASVKGWMKQFKTSFLFLDLRPSHHSLETDSFIKELSREGTPRPTVITLSDGSLPCQVAGELSLVAAAHLIFDEETSQLNSWDKDARRNFERVMSRDALSEIPQSCTLAGTSQSLTTHQPEFFQVLEDLQRVAHRDVTVLLIGETGTGKTTLARIIHERSKRCDAPFQQLACGALPAEIIESELFGHIRGAFTGAERNKIGRFQAAGKGTLLLDEIDVLDVKQQAKLLKVIETGEYEMVGSTEPMQSDARLITASNINLEDLTGSNRFRSDLYYRLSVLEFRLLPLRERPIDIVPMAVEFVEECCREHEIQIQSIDLEFLHALQSYSWPGNIRELKNHIRRAVLFAENGRLQKSDLSAKVTESPITSTMSDPELCENQTLAEQVADNERELLMQALEANRHNRTRTAQSLGISRVGLYKKMRRLGLLEDSSRGDLKRAS